jgi:hypothetical protein
MTLNPTPATVAKAIAKSARPQLELVPDTSQGSHPKADSTTCGATRIYAGKEVACVLELHHAGNHQKGGIYWRPGEQ